MANPEGAACQYYSLDGKCTYWDQTENLDKPSRAGTTTDGDLGCLPAFIRDRRFNSTQQNPFSEERLDSSFIESDYVSEATVNQLAVNQARCDAYTPGGKTSQELIDIYTAEKGERSGIHIDALIIGDVDVASLQPGDEISGLSSLKDINLVSSVFMREIESIKDPYVPGKPYFSANQGKFRNSLGYSTPAETIQKDLNKRHFLGRTGVIKTVILEPDISFVGRKMRAEIHPDSVRTFLTGVDLYSGGRGLIGTYFQKTSVYYRETEHSEGVSTAHKHITGIAGTDAVDLLRFSAKTSADQRKLEGLATPFRGSLPSLGKNRP